MINNTTIRHDLANNQREATSVQVDLVFNCEVVLAVIVTLVVFFIVVAAVVSFNRIFIHIILI